MTSQTGIDDLIRRIAMGDRPALRALYQQTSARLFGICLRVLHDRGEAEEALEEIYLRIWTHTDPLIGSGTRPMTQLVLLARDCAVARRRARPAGHPQPAGEPDWARCGGPVSAIRIPQSAGIQRIVRDLAALPSDRAAMIRRAFFDGHGYGDLAHAAGVEGQSLRPWLRRSLVALRESLCQ